MEYTFGLQPPNGTGPLFVASQVLALLALAGIAYGYLGIWWRGGVAGRAGKISVGLFVTGYILIIVAGVFALLLREDESPLIILFPVGGLLMDLGAVLTGIFVARAGRWRGWRRWMPLVYAGYLWLVIEIPFILGVYPDGPGAFPEIFQGFGLLLVALAVYVPREAATAVAPELP